jgi:hypothetical protein
MKPAAQLKAPAANHGDYRFSRLDNDWSTVRVRCAVHGCDKQIKLPGGTSSMTNLPLASLVLAKSLMSSGRPAFVSRIGVVVQLNAPA